MEQRQLDAIIVSNASLDNYPNNTLASFTNTLPGQLQLKSDGRTKWFACVESLSIQTSFSNLPPTLLNRTSPHFIATYAEHYERYGFSRAHVRQEYSLPNRYYRRQDLLRELNNMFSGNLAKRARFEIDDDYLVVNGDRIVLLIHPEVADYFRIAPIRRYFETVYNVHYLKLYFKKQNNDWIYGASEFTLMTNIPKYIKVVMDQLHPGQDSQNCLKTLAVFPYGRHRQDGAFFVETDRREYLPLETGSHNSVSVRLLDEEGRLLQLTRGQPTVVKMKFAFKGNEEFILRLSSKDVNSTGTNSDFRVNLASPLLVTYGMWKIALGSIQFPNQFAYLGNDGESVNIYYKHGDMQDGTITLSEKDFSNTHQPILEKISFLVRDLTDNVITPIVEDGYFTIDNDSDGASEIRFDGKLAYLLGMTELYFPNEIFTVPEVEHYIPPYDINLARLAPNSMMLYTDIIQPIIIGSENAKILKHIPIKHTEDGLLQMYESKHLNFIPLSHSRISSIVFKLMQYDGSPIKFSDSTEELIYSIVFSAVE